jgi:hypothetical protein
VLWFLAVTAVVWFASCLLVVGICAAARRGDDAMREATAEAPDPRRDAHGDSLRGQVAGTGAGHGVREFARRARVTHGAGSRSR